MQARKVLATITEKLRPINDAFESLAQAHLGGGGNAAAGNWKYRAIPLLSDSDINSLYRSNWICRAVVNRKVEVALKKGWKCSSAALKKYQKIGYPARRPDGVIQRAEKWARAYGGALVIAKHEQGAGNLATELSANPGPVEWLDVVPKPWLKIESAVVGATKPNPGEPLVYIVTDGPRKDLRIHASRTVAFMGDPPGPEDETAQLEDFWGQSVLQSVYEELLRVGQRNTAVDALLTRASIAALRINGLLEAIAAEKDSVLDKRLQVLADGIRQNGMVLLDEGEDYTHHNLSFSGLDAPAMTSLQMVCGAARYPMTVLLGMSPAGMNATGESDLRNFYDELGAYRETNTRPRYETIMGWLSGQQETVSFPPLWQPTSSEKGTLLASTVNAYEVIGSWGTASEYELTKALQADGLLPESLTLIKPDLPDPEDFLEDPNAPPQSNTPPRTAAQAENGLPQSPAASPEVTADSGE